MRFKFSIDKHNGKLHIWNRHRLTEKEVIDAFPNKKEEYRDPSGAWVRKSLAVNKKYMRIVYLKNPDHLYIITAFYL